MYLRLYLNTIQEIIIYYVNTISVFSAQFCESYDKVVYYKVIFNTIRERCQIDGIV